MLTVFKHTLRRYRGQIIGWGIAMFLYGAINIPFYDLLVQDVSAFDQLVNLIPPELWAFFGAFDVSAYASPAGYLGLQYFDVMAVLILGTFAVLAGSGLLASDEEAGRLDLILAHPVSRASLFWGRMMGFAAATVIVLLISWLGLVLPMGFTTMKLGWGEVALPFLSLLAVLMAFGAAALLFSMVLPARNIAAMAAGLLLVASYIFTSLDRLLQLRGNTDLELAARLTPLYYYQGGQAINELNVGWLIGLLVTALVLAALAWWRFQQRDIRVGGEGGWRLSLRRRTA
jgi:ABC-2 type transport system permease protein